MNTTTNTITVTTEKPKIKRGRRTKTSPEQVIETIAVLTDVPTTPIIVLDVPLPQDKDNTETETDIELNEQQEEKEEQPQEAEPEPEEEPEKNAKKRGRKPKGGKIVQQMTPVQNEKENKPNIILHLKCSMKDLVANGEYNSNFTSTNIDPYNYETNTTTAISKNELKYELLSSSSAKEESNEVNTIYNPVFPINTYITQNVAQQKNEEPMDDSIVNTVDTREIWRKLKILEQNLHLNNISDKKSACFWCSYDFDNPPIYIPKHFIKSTYHVYGCFCSPECAVAHLMEENIDSSVKFERYHLINHIYSKIYEYNKNIKPAPNPHYMLDKFYGNLTIQEYRSLLRSERLFLIVDKPLTRILPEFHEDNDEFIINNKIIPSNNYQVKKKLQRKMPQSKNNIVNEKFGIQSAIN